MSQKKARAERTEESKLSLVQDLDTANRTLEDLEAQLEAATEQRTKKLEGDREYLYNNIMMVSKKYLTAEGYMDARNTFESLIFGERLPDHESTAQAICCDIAQNVSEIARTLAASIDSAEIDDLTLDILDSLTTKDFVTTTFSRVDVCHELILANLARNVESALEGLIEFRDRSDEAITKIIDAMNEASDKVDEAKAAIKDEPTAE